MRAHAPTRRGARRGSTAVWPRWRASRLLAGRRGCRRLPPSILCLFLSRCRRQLGHCASFLRPPRARGGRHGAEPCVLRHFQSLATGVANCPGWQCYAESRSTRVQTSPDKLRLVATSCDQLGRTLGQSPRTFKTLSEGPGAVREQHQTTIIHPHRVPGPSWRSRMVLGPSETIVRPSETTPKSSKSQK